jgi:putative inorganic carbon (HCO3(-)) transporter
VFRILAFAELWTVGLAAGLTLVLPPLLPFVMILAAFFWLLRLIAFRPLTRRTPAGAPILFLGLWLLMTLWVTGLPQKTVPQVLWMLMSITLYYDIVNWTDTIARFRLWLNGLVAVGLALAFSAPFTTDWSFRRLPSVPDSFYSLFKQLAVQAAHPNIIAGLLVLLIPLALALLLFGDKTFHWAERVLAALAFVSMTIMLALTQSRGAWLAFIAVLAVMPLLRWRWGWVLTGVVFAGSTVAIYFYGPLRFLESAFYNSAAASLEGRLEIWSRAISMIRDFPLSGVGMGSYGQVADALYPHFILPPGGITHAHNLFLQIAVDLGIPGLAAWSALLVASLTQAWRVYHHGRTTRDALAAGYGAGILGSLLGAIIHGFTDAVPWGTNQPALVLWVLLALITAAGNFFLNSNN